MDVNPKATQYSRAALGIWNTLDSSSKSIYNEQSYFESIPCSSCLIQSSGNRKADPSQYTTNLDFCGIMHNLLIYFYSESGFWAKFCRRLEEKEQVLDGSKFLRWQLMFFIFLFFRDENKHSKLCTLDQKDAILDLLALFGKNQLLWFKNVFFLPLPFKFFASLAFY